MNPWVAEVEKCPVQKKSLDVLGSREAGRKEGEKKCLENCRVESLVFLGLGFAGLGFIPQRKEGFAVSVQEKLH